MICVDASVAAKWVLPEEHSDKALMLAADCARARRRIVAPPLLPIEVGNILRQRMLREGITLERAHELFTAFRTFRVRLLSPDDLTHQALTLAAAYGLPAIYDAHSVALAQIQGCLLWTDDRRLLRAIEGKLACVRPIGEYHGILF